MESSSASKNEVQILKTFFRFCTLICFIFLTKYCFEIYIDYLRAKNASYIKLCKELDCVNPQLKPPKFK